MKENKNTMSEKSHFNELQEDENLIMISVIRFWKGCVSGLAASAILQPLQVVKTSM